MARIEVAEEKDIAEGTAKVVMVGGRQVALFRKGGKLFAIDNACRHQGLPLAEGELDGTVVQCRGHGWRFDIGTGKCLTVPGMDVAHYEVTVENGKVVIDQ